MTATRTKHTSAYGHDSFDSDFRKRWARLEDERPVSMNHHSAPGTTAGVWDAIRLLPGVRQSRTVNNAVFLLSSFPIGVAAFVLAVTGASLGAGLAILGIGFVILIWTIGLLLRFSMIERDRITAFQGVQFREPDYPQDQGANLISHLFHIMKSGQVRRDLAYMLAMFPVGILELALVFFPGQALLASFMYFVLGSSNPMDFFGWSINSFADAVACFGVGIISFVPVALLINFVAAFHTRVALALFGRK